jgi:IS30 family transposase
MVKYQRFTMIEREEISRLLASGYSIRKIATVLNRIPSTISREVNRSVVHRCITELYLLK